MIFKFALSLLLLLSTSCLSPKLLVKANEYKQVGNFINIYNSKLLTSNKTYQYENNSNSNQSKSNYYETNVGFSNGLKHVKITLNVLEYLNIMI